MFDKSRWIRFIFLGILVIFSREALVARIADLVHKDIQIGGKSALEIAKYLQLEDGKMMTLEAFGHTEDYKKEAAKIIWDAKTSKLKISGYLKDIKNGSRGFTTPDKLQFELKQPPDGDNTGNKLFDLKKSNWFILWKQLKGKPQKEFDLGEGIYFRVSNDGQVCISYGIKIAHEDDLPGYVE